MVPVVTLNHLTLPAWVLTPPVESSALSAVGLPTAVEDAGFRGSLRGWESDATVNAFVEFVKQVVRRWRKDVQTWITINEPVGSMIGVGYVGGIWPPGFNLDGARAKSAYLNLIKAHCRAFEAIKRLQPRSKVGFAHAMMHAKTSLTAAVVPQDVQEASRNQFDYFYNWHFLNAVINGDVDLNIHRRPADQDVLRGKKRSDFFGFPVDAGHPWTPKADFVGINYYRSVYVYYHQFIAMLADFTGGGFDNDLAGKEEPHNLLNDLGWEISPEGLGLILREVQRRYGLPVMITENGMPERTDRNRAPYTLAHLQQVLAAMRDGVDVKGYLHWSLVDNFEWHEGYRDEARFGLFRVDRKARSLPRRITTGALALREVVSAGGVTTAVHKYGVISPRGDRVRPPRLSPYATFSGTVGKSQVTLLFSLVRDDEIGGMMFLQSTKTWIPLEKVRWDAAGSTLFFEHASPLGGATRSYRGLAAGGRLTGTCLQPDGEVQWRVSRVPLSGTWHADSWLRRFDLSQPEGRFGGWQGKVLVPGAGAAWQPLPRVALAKGVVTLGDGLRTFQGRLKGAEVLTGSITTKGRSGKEDWSALRLPDGLPF
jgi:beta-glucosidase/6-phospho-beta-glucosidase/beta-galactosidase